MKSKEFETKVVFYGMLGIILILLFLYFTKEDTVKEVTKVITKVDTVYNTIDNTLPQKIKKVEIKVRDTFKINDTITKIIYRNKETLKYNYIDSLANGIISSTIVADSIYSRHISLKTFNTTTTKETVKTIVRNDIFIGSSLMLDGAQKIQNVSVDGYLTIRNKFLIKVGVGVNPVDSRLVYSAGFGIRLK